MDGWRDILHFDFHGEHVLFSGLRISSYSTFLVASLLTVFLCASEKYLSYLLSSRWNPPPSRKSRLGTAAFRAAIYWVLTLIRLLYMLLGMTFHVGLILVVVTTLSVGQFIIECVESRQPQFERRLEGAPLLSRSDLTGSAEYLDISTGTRDRMLAAPEYPPRRKSDARARSPRALDGNTIFAMDDGDEVV